MKIKFLGAMLITLLGERVFSHRLTRRKQTSWQKLVLRALGWGEHVAHMLGGGGSYDVEHGFVLLPCKARREDVSPMLMLNSVLNHSFVLNQCLKSHIFFLVMVLQLASGVWQTRFTRHIRNFLALWEMHFHVPLNVPAIRNIWEKARAGCAGLC